MWWRGSIYREPCCAEFPLHHISISSSTTVQSPNAEIPLVTPYSESRNLFVSDINPAFHVTEALELI